MGNPEEVLSRNLSTSPPESFTRAQAERVGMRQWRQGRDKGRDEEAEAGPWEKLVQLCLLASESARSALGLTCLFIFTY